MRTFLLLVATLVAFAACTLLLPGAVRGDYGHGHGHGGHGGGHAGGHHGAGGGHFALHHGAPKVKATGKHHHKLKPPKPPKPPKPVKTGGLLHLHK